MIAAYESLGPELHDPFPPTRWSIVADVGDSAPEKRGRAWNELFKNYWAPLFAYVRRRSSSEQDAEDLTQAFFAMLAQGGPLADLDASRGKMRAYLLTALKHFIISEHRKDTALKRGGGEAQLSLDVNDAESRLEATTGNEASPDVEFDRQWALQLIEEALASVEAEYSEKGKRDLFEAFKPHLSFTTDRAAHSDIAAKLGMKSGAVRIAVYRLRQRFAAIMKAKIAETVLSEEEVDEELAHLMNVFSAA